MFVQKATIVTPPIVSVPYDVSDATGEGLSLSLSSRVQHLRDAIQGGIDSGFDPTFDAEQYLVELNTRGV